MEKATFGAGCFWGVQAEFDKLPIKSSKVGFMGGQTKLDSEEPYKQVCNTDTGHAEVVQVEFDPESINYQKLLNTFLSIHDATQVNRQGPDIGSQYRSVIFYHTKEQKELAQVTIDKLNEKNKIATQLVKASDFIKAEEYHQKYLEKQGKASCSI